MPGQAILVARKLDDRCVLGNSPRCARWAPTGQFADPLVPVPLEIEDACPGVSRDMVRVVLRSIKAEGWIAPTGKGWGPRWVRVARTST